MYAIIATGGKQYKVEEGDVIKVEKLGLEAGSEVTFDQVLLVGDKDVKVGTPTVDGASVKATVVAEGKSKKVIVYRYKRKTGYHKKNGNITGFHMEGHAGYADRGSDIVCASISVLAINCVNSIEEFTEDSFSEGMDEERGMISFDLTGEISEKTQLLLQSMLLGIEHIAEEYGKKYVQIINR